jgi:CubicO group peptidase (beta-lactamase class C family)
MSSYPIAGIVKPGFEKVREAFVANFSAEREVGASFAVMLADEPIVDLWGGFADGRRSRPWARDTIVNVYSTTKGMAAACVAMLVDRGLIRYETPVGEIWPEMAQSGKGSISIETLMSHQAGLCGFRQPVTVDDYYDPTKMAEMLEGLEPWWEPGTQNGYHAITFGFLAGELVRRTTGSTLGQFFEAEIAKPLAAEFFIGLPESEEHRVAEIVRPKSEPKLVEGDPSPAQKAALANPALDPEVPNTRAWRAAEIPAANGQGNARGIARVYGAMASGGSSDRVTLLSPETVERATAERCQRTDVVLGFPIRWSAGWILNFPPLYGPRVESFGHSGWGGSFGFADPVNRLGVGYAMNQMDPNLQGDPRAATLIQAVYESLD